MVKLLCPPGWETEPVADIIIFYCEYSSHRAPTMSQNLRNLDRKAHFDSYPSLSYPYLYIISKGYREFYVEFPQLCVPPGGYTPMHSKNKQNMTRKYSIQQQHSWRRNNEYSKPRSSLSLEALLSPRTQVWYLSSRPSDRILLQTAKRNYFFLFCFSFRRFTFLGIFCCLFCLAVSLTYLFQCFLCAFKELCEVSCAVSDIKSSKSSDELEFSE